MFLNVGHFYIMIDVKENSCILTIGLPKRYINYRYN